MTRTRAPWTALNSETCRGRRPRRSEVDTHTSEPTAAIGRARPGCTRRGARVRPAESTVSSAAAAEQPAGDSRAALPTLGRVRRRDRDSRPVGQGAVTARLPSLCDGGPGPADCCTGYARQEHGERRRRRAGHDRTPASATVSWRTISPAHRCVVASGASRPVDGGFAAPGPRAVGSRLPRGVAGSTRQRGRIVPRSPGHRNLGGWRRRCPAPVSRRDNSKNAERQNARIVLSSADPNRNAKSSDNPDVAAVQRDPRQFEITAEVVRDLLRDQHPDLADRPVRLGAQGWVNQLWRLGDDLAVRLPGRTQSRRRASAQGARLAARARATAAAGGPGPAAARRALRTVSPALDRHHLGPGGARRPRARHPCRCGGRCAGRLPSALHQPAPAGAPVSLDGRGGPLSDSRKGFAHFLAEAVERGLIAEPDPSAPSGTMPSPRRPGMVRRCGCMGTCTRPTS